MRFIDRLRRALAVGTKDRDSTLLERGIALHERGDLQGAGRIYDQLLRGDPLHADALHLTGLIAHQQGDNARARQLIGDAIGQRPAAARFHFNLGNALAGEDKAREAAISFQRAADLDPGHAASWFNLGSALARLNQYGEAVAALRRAFELSPALPDLRKDLAQSLINAANAGSLPTSAFREASDLLLNHWQQTDRPLDARMVLAIALQEDRQWSLAAVHYLALLEASPDFEMARNNLANCYNQLGRMPEAIGQYREVLRISPGNALAASGIISCMNYDSEVTPAQMYAAHVEWANTFAAPRPDTRAAPRMRAAARRLRLAYVSPDFRRHPVATMFAPVLERHDRTRFEISCYYNYPRDDEVTHRIRKAADIWVNIHQLNDSMLAQRIREDDIDILVDLAGHTSYGRLPAYANRPAPLQISWLGYFATTGMAQMDAFISDPHSSPPGQDKWFRERLIRLPATRFTFEPGKHFPAPGEPRRRQPGAVTFGCLNNLAKINHRVLAAWAAILGRLPASNLLIQAFALEDPANREAFLNRCDNAGIARTRVDIRAWATIEDAARTYHDVDIALDPFPFCGGMTSFDTLWMGVPIVTLAGQMIASRQSAAMLVNLELSDLVANDVDSYVAIAVALARDPDRLDRLRSTLRSAFAASALSDHDSFTVALEGAYLQLWRELAASPS